LGYGEGKNDIVLLGDGEGGLDEMKQNLTDDKIYFGVFEVVVEGNHHPPLPQTKKIFVKSPDIRTLR